MIQISRGSYATMIGFVMEACPIAIGISPIVQVAGVDSWMVPLLALPLVLLLVWPLFRYYYSRGDVLLQNQEGQLSKSLSLLLVPLSLILLYLISFTTRVFVDLIHMTYLPQTPEIVIYMAVLAICSYAAIMGGEVIARVALIAFVIKFLVILLSPVFAIGQIRFEFLAPFLGDGVMPLIRSSIQPLAWFAEAAVLVLLWPTVKQAKYRTVAYGYLLGMSSYWILAVSSMLIFSAPLTARFVYPGLEFVQMMAMGDFLERIDAILAAIWTMSMVVKISVYLYLLSIVMKRVFVVNMRARFVFPTALLCSWGADNIAENFPQYMMIYRYAWPMLMLLMLLNLFLIGWACGRIKQKAKGDAKPASSGSVEEEGNLVSP